MRLDRDAVVPADLDIDADDAAMAHRLEQARVEDQRAAMCDAGLHDHVGPQAPDHLLDADHVLRQLDHRAAHPGEAVDVLHVPAAAQPGGGYRLERLGRVERMLLRRAVRVVDGYAAMCLIDGEHRYSCAQRPAGSGRSATRLLAVGPNSASSRAVSIGGCRTVGASGAKPVRQPAMSRRQDGDGGSGWCWRRRRRCRSAAGRVLRSPAAAAPPRRRSHSPWRKPDPGGTSRRRSRGLRAAPDPGMCPPACRCHRRSTAEPRALRRMDGRDTAPRRPAS